MFITRQLNYFSLAVFLTALLYPEGLLAYQVSTANKYGDKSDPEKFGRYQSIPVNKFVERAKDDKTKAAKLAENPEYFNESNVEFTCPGNSLVTGIISKYHYFNTDADNRNYSSDRNFAFICTFFEDPQDRLLKKVNCDTSESPFDNDEQKPGTSQCTGETQFIGGLTSKKYRPDKDADGALAFFRDRMYKSQCCELKDQDGNAVKSAGSCNMSEFKAGSNFTFECPEGSILKSIESAYDGDKWDRSYKLKCCPAAT